MTTLGTEAFSAQAAPGVTTRPDSVGAPTWAEVVAVELGSVAAST